MDTIEFIDIIISMWLHRNTRIMLFNSLLLPLLHYSQQRTPEYQIEMGSFSPILKKLVLQINIAPTSKDT